MVDRANAVMRRNPLPNEVYSAAKANPLNRADAMKFTYTEGAVFFRRLVVTLLESLDFRLLGSESYRNKLAEDWTAVGHRFALVTRLFYSIISPEEGSESVNKYIVDHLSQFQDAITIAEANAKVDARPPVLDETTSATEAALKEEVQRLKDQLQDERGRHSDYVAASAKKNAALKLQVQHLGGKILSFDALTEKQKAVVKAAVEAIPATVDHVKDSLPDDATIEYRQFAQEAMLKVNPSYIHSIRDQLLAVLGDSSVISSEILNILPKSFEATYANPAEVDQTLPAAVSSSTKTTGLEGWGAGKMSSIDVFNWLTSISAALPKQAAVPVDGATDGSKTPEVVEL
ncbi:MAG: hypothetical protein L7U87_06885 [Chlamydiales bacterium]|nr:hypothetical protein [Chlamydiales bacterium]